MVLLPDGRVLNQESVRAGFAWSYRKYAPEDETLRQLGQEARHATRGLWADPNPIPPWEWRIARRRYREVCAFRSGEHLSVQARVELLLAQREARHLAVF